MEIQNQSENTMEVRYVDDVSDNDDPEVFARRRKTKKNSDAPSSERRLTIHIFGATAEGQSVQVNIGGFEPFFYVKLPNNLREVQETFAAHLRALVHKRNDWALKREGSYTVTYELRQVLMGYTAGREFTFAKLAVKSLQTWRALKSYFLGKQNEFLFRIYKDADPLEVFEANLDLVTELPRFNFFDMSAPIFSRPRYLPGSKINGAQIDHALVTDGCIINGAKIVHSIIGLRTVVGAGTELHRAIVLGSDYYESDESVALHERQGKPRVGVGSNCRIENALIDKNARIGNNVTISPAGKPENVDHELYFIRDGIVVIPKNGVIPHGTVI